MGQTSWTLLVTLTHNFTPCLADMSLAQIKDNKIYTCIHESLTKVSMETYRIKP